MDEKNKLLFDEKASDWVPLEKFPRLAANPKFVSGDKESERIRIRFYQKKNEPTLVGKIWFGPGCEGPPGHAHGGSVAAAVDEVMGAVAWHAGYTVVAARLVTNFRKMVPLSTVLNFTAKISKVDGKKVFTTAILEHSSLGITSDAEGLFIVIDVNRFPNALERK